MLVKTTDGNTGLLHHIGNADAFETEFAKPLGRNAYNPSVCVYLISFRIAHLSSPLLSRTCRFRSNRCPQQLCGLVWRFQLPSIGNLLVISCQRQEPPEYCHNPHYIDASPLLPAAQSSTLHQSLGSKLH